MFYDGLVMLHTTIQEIPPDDTGTQALGRDELRVEAEDYDAALTAAEGQVPAGWRLIALRVDRAPGRGARS